MTAGGSAKAFAYGKADQPIAQVEISGNCNNPSFPLCAEEVGLGGVWVWSELDTSGDNTTSGTMDATVAFCGHVIRGGGPGSAGGGGGPVRSGVWYTYPSLEDAMNAYSNAFPFYDSAEYTGRVWLLDFFPGTGADDFIAVVPAQMGHYSLQPVPAVTIQTQVAP